MYLFKDKLEPGEAEELDKLYRGVEHGSVYQHPMWPDEMQAGQRKRFFLQVEDGQIVLSAKITESHLAKAPFVKYANNRRGFISSSRELIVPAIKELVSRYKEQKFARLTVEQCGDLQDAEYVERTLLKDGLSFTHNFNNGARATLLLQLGESIEAIHDRFANVLKKNIVTAQKKGATIREVTDTVEFEKFIAVYRKMEATRGVRLGSAEYLAGFFRFIQTTGLGHFLACFDKTETLIGGIMLFKEAGRLVYIFGASSPDHKSIPQLHLALYEGIKLAKGEGLALFDFGGYAFDAAPDEQVYGINQFKYQFCNNVAFYPKSMTFETNRLNAWFGDTLLKLRSLAGRRSKGLMKNSRLLQPNLLPIV